MNTPDSFAGISGLVWGLVRPLSLCCGLSAYFAWKVFYALYLSPLRNVPGSFWTRISYLPMFYHDIRGTEPEFMNYHANKYGSVFVMEPKKIAVCDPEDCLVVLGSHSFLKDHHYSNVEFIEPNMFLTRDPELNKQRRRQVGPVLSLSSLKRMEPQILEAGPKQLCDKWDRDIQNAAGSQGVARVCYHSDFTLMTFDVISSLGFGQSHRSLTTGDKKIVNWVNRTFTLIFLQAVLPIVKTRLFKNIFAKSLYNDVDEFIALGTRAINDRKQLLSTLSSDESKPRDMLQSFIDAEDPESKIRMTSEQVSAETIISLLAGSDTSSNTLSWTIHLLLMHPEYYQRAVSEVRQVFDREHLIVYSEAKLNLPFLDACIYESMRLMPVSSNLARCMPRGGVVIGGYFIPENHTCSVSINAANRNSRVWKDPMKYLPERFIKDDAKKRMVLTFSAGVRVCPGRHLALMEIFTTLANLLNRYDLELPEDSLFTPDKTDKNGSPVLMPYRTAGTCAPKFPERDCVALITKRK
ncbi:hypothetical protein GGI15_001142 [Coemansia interrupta]|uniref:Cytochrome P450 n=1 Tax=Coemansia interrupta TaxID=1126814 RepID=A0A9W8LMV0_9FUNG|nr:hypothetical protein GGI15_001142 [Coemansia interrupta]